MRGTLRLAVVLSLLVTPAAVAQQHAATVGDFPSCQEAAIDSDTNRIFATVGLAGPYGIAVIDGATASVIATVPTAAYPWGVAFNPLTNRVYVASQGGGGVTVIDAETYTVITTINPFAAASGVLVDVRTNRIYATQESGTNLWIIDGATDTQIGTIGLPVFRPSLMALNPATDRLYIANNAFGPIVVFDVATNAIVNTISVAHGGHLAMDPVNQRLYFTEVVTHQLAVIDLATEAVSHVFLDPAPLASDPPIGVAYNSNTNRIFVSRAISHSVDVLDAGSFDVVATIPSGNFGIAVNETNNLVCVCERGGSVDGDPPSPGRLHILRDETAPLAVSIDVRPKAINLRAKGVVSAVIFSDTTFDATIVDPATVQLAAAPATRSNIEDANGDGTADLVVHFDRAALQLTMGDTTATLTGKTFGGQNIEGNDSVRIVR